MSYQLLLQLLLPAMVLALGMALSQKMLQQCNYCYCLFHKNQLRDVLQNNQLVMVVVLLNRIPFILL